MKHHIACPAKFSSKLVRSCMFGIHYICIDIHGTRYMIHEDFVYRVPYSYIRLYQSQILSVHGLYCTYMENNCFEWNSLFSFDKITGLPLSLVYANSFTNAQFCRFSIQKWARVLLAY